jgi:hypothetical protein
MEDPAANSQSAARARKGHLVDSGTMVRRRYRVVTSPPRLEHPWIDVANELELTQADGLIVSCAGMNRA